MAARGLCGVALVVVAALLPLRCQAHWRLTKPVPRSGGAYENDPLAPDANTQEDWVCRHPHPNPSVQRPTIEAGSTTGIVYGTGAIGHAGDCAVYISYDTDRARRAMRWVKIANLPDCRSQINELVPIVVPSELPAGGAVLRWDQYALHQMANTPPFIEWFIQCADIVISSSSGRSWESFNSFSIIDNGGTPAYPSSVSSYRSPYKANQAAPGKSEFWMTGPACVDDSINQCALTAVGTKGYTGFGGESNTASPSPSPAPVPSSLPSTTTPAPTPGPVPSVGDAMCCYAAGCSTYGTSFCSAIGSWCSQSSAACESCGGELCTDPTGSYYPAPLPPPAPTPAPAGSTPQPESPVPLDTTPVPASPQSPAEEEAQCCYAAGCSSFGTSSCSAAGTWCSQSADACSSCGGTLCKGGTSLLSEEGHATARRQKFLRRRLAEAGHALIQVGMSSPKAAAEAFGSGDLHGDEL